MNNNDSTKVIINKNILSNKSSDSLSANQNKSYFSNTLEERFKHDADSNKDSPKKSTRLATIKNRYKLERLVGQGGLCDVYIAKDLVLDSTGASFPFVAIKLLREEFCNQPDIARVMFREAQNAQKLSHPNIIRVFDFGIDEANYYIVMEYLEGETLECIIKRSRPKGFNKKISVEIIHQLLSALRYAHSLGIIHADIKPGNIMLCDDNTLKILDFGVSQTRCIRQDKYSAKASETSSELLGYTPNYASKNILEGNEPHMSDDLFSVICILYELLSSKHPYNKQTASEALAEGIKLTKPKNMAWSLWFKSKSILKSGICSKDLSADQLLSILHKSYLKPVLFCLTFAAVVTSCYTAYDFHFSEIDELNQQLIVKNQQLDNIGQQLETPAYVLMNDLASISDFDPVIQNGLMRTHRERLIESTIKRIDKQLNVKSGYPDYKQIESTLNSALHIYPDSHQLEMQLIDIQNSQNVLLQSLSRRINSQLEDESILTGKEPNEAIEQFGALGTISKDFNFVVSPLAQQVFAKSLKQAIKARNFEQLLSLHRFGNKFFSHSQDSKVNLDYLNTTIVHIEKLRAYQLANNSNDTSFSFPEESAKILFNKELASIDNSLSRKPSLRNLDHSLKLIRNLSDYFPDDASDILERKEQLANKYAKHSETLKKSRKRRSARIALSRSKDLLKEIDQAGQ